MSADAERATVRIVTGDDHETGNTGFSQPDLREPEARPPITPPPPQELENDLGGPAVPNPTPDQLVEAAGGSVAQRMRARFEAISATEEFAVPGWELDDGRPGLILEARAFGDRKAFNQGISNEAFIAKSTNRLLFVNDDGSRDVIKGGWGPALAEIIGVKVGKAADLVALVISKPDPNNPDVRIPNVAGIGALATEIVAWAHSGKRQAEEDMGE
jgi:hypothetical protein